MFKRCAICRVRRPGGIATVYWRWFADQDKGVGYRMDYCINHFEDMMVTAGAVMEPTDETADVSGCMSCGNDDKSELQAVFVWVYPPKMEGWYSEWQSCNDCFARVADPVRLAGAVVEDKSQPTRAKTDSAWAKYSRTA